MKDILMFSMASCPYCRQAQQWVAELTAENEAYRAFKITVVDERLDPDTASKYNYYYVPTYYVGGIKMHEGVATKDKIKAVLDAALE